MQTLSRVLALISLPFLLAAYFGAFLTMMFGGIAMLFAFSSSCGSYGACLTASNAPWLIVIAVGFVAGLGVIGLWTRWVANVLDAPWLMGRRRAG